jgi:hypothetical protein
MTTAQQLKLADELVNEAIGVLKAKGKDYSSDTDALANFKRNADKLGLTKYQVWSLYFTKHVDAIINSIKRDPVNPQVESEPIKSRVVDIINYGICLVALLEENE